MIMNKCSNCKYEGEKEDYCPICGDNIILKGPAKKVEQETKLDMDLNNDGKVDDEDVSIAAKVMRKAKSIKRKGKR